MEHATDRGHRAHITDLARDLGGLGAWVRLHYVYPYPHVRQLIPLMAEGLVLPCASGCAAAHGAACGGVQDAG